MATPSIIAVAITGSLPKKKDNPAVPISIDEQIESTHEAFEAGATLVHLHVRNDDETPTADAERFAQVLQGIRKHCPGMITQISTGGRSGAGRERGAMLFLKPDMASLAPGSVNFPTRVYDNSPELVDWLAGRNASPPGHARNRGFRPVDDLSGGGDAKGKEDRWPPARAVRHGRQECDAGRSRGVRILRAHAARLAPGCDVDGRRNWQGSAHARPVVTRVGRTLPDGSGGQRSHRSPYACLLQCSLGKAGGRSVRGIRSATCKCCGGPKTTVLAITCGLSGDCSCLEVELRCGVVHSNGRPTSQPMSAFRSRSNLATALGACRIRRLMAGHRH